MNFYLIITLGIILSLGIFLYKKKWELKHVVSLILSLMFVFFFAYYGAKILLPIWPHANAASFWVLMFFIIYGGGAFMGSIPFLVQGINKKDMRKIKKVIKFWFAIGLIYVAVDNSTMGPFAVGPHSPYTGSLCKLDPTYYSEDVFAGCVLEKVGINTTSELAIFLTYIVFTTLLLALAGLIIHYKRLEKIMFIN